MTQAEQQAIDYVRRCGVTGPESCPLTDSELLAFIRCAGGAELMLAASPEDIADVAFCF